MSSESKRLYRSRDERMIAGVCGGLGEYLNTDPTVIRIIFVVLAIIGVGFGGLILYLAMWLIVPEEPVEVVAVVPTPAPVVEETVVEETVVEEPAQEGPTEE